MEHDKKDDENIAMVLSLTNKLQKIEDTKNIIDKT